MPGFGIPEAIKTAHLTYKKGKSYCIANKKGKSYCIASGVGVLGVREKVWEQEKDLLFE